MKTVINLAKGVKELKSVRANNMFFYKDIDMSKVTRKQIIADWRELFPGFSEGKGRKDVAWRQLNGPFMKVFLLDFDCSNPYDTTMSICSFFNGYCICAGDWVAEKKHYMIICRNGERQVNYKYTYKCLMERCANRGLDFYKPLSVSQIFNLYKSAVANSSLLYFDSISDTALIAAWAGMDRLAKEAADWAEDHFRKKIEEWENGDGPVRTELRKLWRSLSFTQRKDPHWADDLLSQFGQPIIPPLIPEELRDSDDYDLSYFVRFETPNDGSKRISLNMEHPMEYFSRKRFKSLQEWRENLNARMADKDGLHKEVEKAIAERKLENISRQELIRE